MKTFAILLLCSIALSVHAGESASLKLTATISLPGVKGRFDHFAIDEKGHRLFVAALGNDTLEVIDVAAGKRLKSITGLHKPTGVLYLAEQNQIVVANGDDGTVKFFHGANYELVKSVGSLDDADNIRFDSKTKLIYVGYGSGALGIIDAAKQEHVGDVKLKAHPESFQLEKNGNRIFVNVPDVKQVAVVDREKRQVIAEWHWEKVEANFPMALDEVNHRLFIGGRKPSWLVIADTKDGRLIKVHSISGDTDDLFYDAKRKCLYVSCGQGFIEVVGQGGSDNYETLEKIPTRNGARTSFFSAALNELYLAVPQRGGQDAELRIFQPQK
jgi:DNA-binding beta-propeller fold protein YncE